MNSAAYIKRQSRVARRASSNAAGLTSICEEASAPTTNVKAKRRQGVSNLRIPSDEDEWRLTLDLFPRPPCDEAESSGSSSGSSSDSELTTPTPSPVAESYEVAHATGAQCIIRCKSIKPLRVAKRAVSPVPPPPPPPPPAPATDVWQDDDDFYAAHAAGFITLAAPLPSSFPTTSSTSSATTRATNRESCILPPASDIIVRPSSQLDPTYAPLPRLGRSSSIPSRAPPPPPIITCHRHSRSASGYEIPNFSRPTSVRPPPSRPPPRTPVPCDASDDFDFALEDYAAYAPLFEAQSSTSSSRNSHFPAEAQGVPSDVEQDDWEEDDVAYVYDNELPISPLVAASPVSPIAPSSPGPDSPLPSPSPARKAKWAAVLGVEQPRAASPAPSVSPVVPPYQGWHPRPRASVLRAALAREPILPAPAAAPSTSSPQTSPVLRSRWSSSTLSSVHSAHGRSPRSPISPSPKSNFSFARRYFPSHSQSPKSPASKSPRAPKPKPKPIGTSQALYHRPAGRNPKLKTKSLTVADVMVVGRPAETCVLAGACMSPDVFTSASAQYASYPPSPSPALTMAMQRSPRRRERPLSSASSTSSSSAWSPASASDVASECSTGSGEGLRRKPIPLEIFLR
ncbi:hypothetical protein FB45DRAFT_1057241 [Roridomyces roridus]|uniref:Uncharacterized protein n=1 Tax=Roridomyces roridus TaxID=1738132 RepID=A0AAD7FPH2_9AGAR|nr:hypothetical protein FB45DRAFT_1057241 [Roridomyces roridus]